MTDDPRLCNCLDNECHAAPGWICRKASNETKTCEASTSVPAGPREKALLTSKKRSFERVPITPANTPTLADYDAALVEIEQLRAALSTAIEGHKVWESVYGSSPTSRAHLSEWESALSGYSSAPETRAPLPRGNVEYAIYVLERYRDMSDPECTCEDCPQCGKLPADCSGTPCAQTCQCSECDHCRVVTAIAGLKGSSQETSALQSVSMEGVPMGDPHPCDLTRAGCDPVTGKPVKASAHPVAVCGKLDQRGLHCQNPPGHEGDCDGMPF